MSKYHATTPEMSTDDPNINTCQLLWNINLHKTAQFVPFWGPLDINSVEASSCCEWSLADFAALLQIFEQKMQ